MQPSVRMELLHKVTNLGGLEKTLRCPHCQAYTRHVSVSYAASEQGWLMKIWGRFFDHVPGTPLLLGNQFACTTCERYHMDGGLLSDLTVMNRRPG